MTKQMVSGTAVEQIPDGYKQDHGYVIPKEWKVVHFDKCFHRLTQKNTENNQNVLTISAQQGLISQLDYYNTLYASEDKTGYFLLQKGDFAYNKSYSMDYPYGAIKQLEKYEKGIVSPLYICFSVNDGINTDFYKQYFEAGMFNREIYKIAQEGARNHGLLNVSTPEFFSSLLVFPPIEEQKKIAEILAQCDKVIYLKEKQLSEIEKKKRHIQKSLLTYLKQNDPQNQVAIRGTIGDLVFDISSGTSVNSESITAEFSNQNHYILKTSAVGNGQFNFREIKQITAADENRASCPIEENTLLVSRMNTPNLVGACALCDRTCANVYLPDRLWKVRVKKSIDIRWLNMVLNSPYYRNIMHVIAGGTSNSMKNISQRDFLNIPLQIPTYGQQKQVADIIESIETVISKHQEELKEWRVKKDALRQLLLTGIVRVKA